MCQMDCVSGGGGGEEGEEGVPVCWVLQPTGRVEGVCLVLTGHLAVGGTDHGMPLKWFQVIKLYSPQLFVLVFMSVSTRLNILVSQLLF